MAEHDYARLHRKNKCHNRTCFVPGCHSGYGGQKCTLFMPPCDTATLMKWRRAIPRADRELTSRDRVCSKHFEVDDIETTYKIRIGDRVEELERGKAKLVPGAVPSLFPNLPKYLSKQPTRKRKQRNKHASFHQPKKTILCASAAAAKSSEPASLSFDVLHDQHASYCPSGWYSMCTDECVSYGRMEIISGQMSVAVSVNINRTMSASVYYRGNEAIGLGSQCLTTAEQLSTIFFSIQVAQPCPGNTDSHLHNSLSSSRIGIFDNSSTWRHVSCARLILQGERCPACSKLRRLLQTSAKRRQMCSGVKLCVKRKSLRVSRVNKLKKQAQQLRVMTAQLKKALTGASQHRLHESIANLPANQQLVVDQCLKQMAAKSSKGMRYQHDWLLSCILLRIKSPKAYSHLRDHAFLPLPSRTTLSRYVGIIRAQAGISDEALEILAKKIRTDADRHGILMFDEVKLREGVKFSVKNLEFEGLVDFGELKTERKPADTGLVFMYRPLFAGWVQAVAMFLSAGATPASTLTKLLLKVILALESHGLWVDGIVCDGSGTNRSLWKEFGISGNRSQLVNRICHPAADLVDSRRGPDYLYFFSDYVHLFKCVRNNLLNKKEFMFPEGIVRMAHFVELLKLDTGHGGLRAVPKLSTMHTEPNNLQRMNVRLAVQLFSNSVADGIVFYQRQGAAALQDADVTVQFVRRLNTLFDVLNAKHPREGLRVNSRNMTFLLDCIDWLESWEGYVEENNSKHKFLSPSTSAGLRVTLHSTLQLSQHLLQSLDSCKYVLTSKFSQDPLELFFGLIRYSAGCDDHPTAAVFMQLYRLLSVYSLLRLPKRSTSVSASGVVLPVRDVAATTSKRSATVALAAECLESMAAVMADDDEAMADDEPDHSLPLTTQNIVYYVAGFVVRHCRRVVKCTDCIEHLMSSTDETPEAELLNVKLRGALHRPSDVLFAALCKLEAVVSVQLTDKFSPFAINNIIEESLSAFLPVQAQLCASHRSWLAAEIAVYYTATRLHWHAKSVNKEAASRKATKNCRKKTKLC